LQQIPPPHSRVGDRLLGCGENNTAKLGVNTLVRPAEKEGG